ncbi:DUF6916 family protein [Haliscomenobacter hydrossis]|uniref:DUF6916 domain-containing protein n=1 Tax=Haliscomenobacter hydrossis (strain ATCC 27775 / DSM 1100 / LMG 10767 / O) TaxID=760192 RepID=F4L4P4_HALH1|nr:hypothetical protein [Haliscomenobacter hydrossis]AEE52992.1 hypothetical protein Halhy_5166 [Haliscomenobacter hydrossis DSM 1100]
MLEQISIANFQPHLNETFSIRFTPEATHPAVLTKVTPWSHGSDKYRQPFTLELETDLKETYYLQGSFTLVHPTAGELVLFMVPLGLGSMGMRYEIVFS